MRKLKENGAGPCKGNTYILQTLLEFSLWSSYLKVQWFGILWWIHENWSLDTCLGKLIMGLRNFLGKTHGMVSHIYVNLNPLRLGARYFVINGVHMLQITFNL